MSARSLRSASASLTRRSSVSFSSRRPRSASTRPGRLRARAEHAGDLAALVADRRIGEREPGLLVVALAVHDERQVFAIGRLARHRRIDQRADVRPDLRPDVVEAPAERARDAWRRGSRRTGRCRGSRAPSPHATNIGNCDCSSSPTTRSQRLRPGVRRCRAAMSTSRARASARPCVRRPREIRPAESCVTCAAAL